MMPRLERLTVLVTSRSKRVRESLAIGATEAGCFSPAIQATSAREAMKVVVRHVCHRPDAPPIDLVVTDCAVPDLMALGLVPDLARGGLLRRPFIARLVIGGRRVSQESTDLQFDLVAPMSESVPTLARLFRTMADHSLARFAATAGG